MTENIKWNCEIYFIPLSIGTLNTASKLLYKCTDFSCWVVIQILLYN